MISEEQARSYYIQVKVFKEHVDKIANHLQEIRSKIIEVSQMMESLDEIIISKALIPVCNGIFVEGQIDNDDTVIVNVGAGTLVRKKKEKAKELLAEQLDELKLYEEKIKTEYIKAINNLEQLQNTIQKKIQDV